MTWLRQRAKGLVALATAMLTAAQTVYGPHDQRIAVALAALGAFGVYFVENEQMPESTGRHHLVEQEPPTTTPSNRSHTDPSTRRSQMKGYEHDVWQT